MHEQQQADKAPPRGVITGSPELPLRCALVHYGLRLLDLRTAGIDSLAYAEALVRWA